jgi:branched-chain amino acid aminotransferase
MNHFQWRPTERPCYLINGEFCADSALPFSHFNRGFLYSDGFFETVRICNGIPQHLALHWNRISSSLRAHRMENKQGLTEKQLGQRLQELCERNAIKQGGRVRITIFRNGGGRYRPESNEMAWIATAEPLQDNLLISEEKGLNVDLYSGMQKQVNPLSNFKNLSSNLYIQAALWAEEEGLDDALIQNEACDVIESSHSNLFLVSNGALYTPGLDSGPVGGIMRASTINLALRQGYKVYECNITPKEMMAADEMFLTNTIRGIQWIARFKDRRYFHTTSKELLKLMNETWISQL